MGMFPATTMTPVAKRAYFVRFTVAKKRTIKFVRFALTNVGTGEDKIDVGIYRPNGAKLERLGSNGGVKVLTTSVGVKVLELGVPVVCEPGNVYFVSIAWDSITGSPQVAGCLNNSGLYGDIFGTGTLSNRMQVYRVEASPLPEVIESIPAANSAVTPYLVPSES